MAFPPRTLQRFALWPGLLLLGAGLGLLWVVQEHWQHPSFPAIDWLRVQSVEARRSFLFGVLLLLAAVRGLGAPGWRRLPVGFVALCGAGIVAGNLLVVQAYRFSSLSAEGAAGAVPVMEDGALVRRYWKTDLRPCRPVSCTPTIVAEQGMVSDLAHGMHAELAQGGGAALRAALWAGQKALVGGMLWARLGLLAMGVAAVGLAAWPRPPTRIVRRSLLVIGWCTATSIPVVNLLFVAVTAVSGLPDLGGLGGRVALDSLGLLGACLLAEGGGWMMALSRPTAAGSGAGHA